MGDFFVEFGIADDARFRHLVAVVEALCHPPHGLSPDWSLLGTVEAAVERDVAAHLHSGDGPERAGR